MTGISTAYGLLPIHCSKIRAVKDPVTGLGVWLTRWDSQRLFAPKTGGEQRPLVWKEPTRKCLLLGATLDTCSSRQAVPRHEG